ncbi:MAG TPA: hypothetical protein VLF43_04485 [Candidatus Saccharimonadales bacterium]|nr:hypothetical protein [Candidatus Saccharimonadales bacterium]
MNDIIIRRRPTTRREAPHISLVTAPRPRIIPQTPPATQLVSTAATPAPHPLPEPRKYARQATPAKKSRNIPQWIQVILAVLLLAAGPIVLQSAILGQVAVVAYGIIAYVWRIPSRTTFTLALIAIITTALFLVVKGDFTPAGNFATYTFLFLSVGVISLTREVKKEGGRVYSIKNNHRA